MAIIEKCEILFLILTIYSILLGDSNYLLFIIRIPNLLMGLLI